MTTRTEKLVYEVLHHYHSEGLFNTLTAATEYADELDKPARAEYTEKKEVYDAWRERNPNAKWDDVIEDDPRPEHPSFSPCVLKCYVLDRPDLPIWEMHRVER